MIDAYASLGGTIGGVIIAVLFTIISLLVGDNFELSWLALTLAIALLIITLGFVIGIMPALLAAYIICKFEIYFSSMIKVIPLFLIGFISTFIFIIWLPITDSFIDRVILLSPLGVIGGVSAMIIGWLKLPRSK